MNSERTIEISSAEDFRLISSFPERNYKLKENINLEGEEVKIKNFCGVLNGNGNVVKNFSREGDHLGCLVVKNKGKINNLKIENNVQASRFAGGICAANNGIIINSSFSGNINAEARIGGIAAKNRGRILNCGVQGNIECQDRKNAGGIVGYNKKGLVKGCHSSVEIIGGLQTGGIAAENSGKIKSCSSDSNISGRRTLNPRVGGLVGLNFKKVVDSCFYGDLQTRPSDSTVGMLIGINNDRVENCHAVSDKGNYPLIDKNFGKSRNNSFEETVEKAEKRITINKI